MHLSVVMRASVSFLLVLGLASFGSNAYATQSNWGELIGYNESTVTVIDKQRQETTTSVCRFDDINARSLLVRDQKGNVITQTTVGSQVMLELTVDSRCLLDHEPVLALLEVRDAKGITNYLTWQNMTINSNEQMAVVSSWVAPDKVGDYEVRAFSFSRLSLQSTMVISQVLTYKITVLPAGLD